MKDKVAPTKRADLPISGELQVRIVHLSGFRITAPTPEAPAGSFEGIASRSGVRDTYGTHWSPFAWTRGGLDSDVYALTWMHAPWEPMGVFRAEEIPDPDNAEQSALHIAGAWDDTTLGRDGYGRARSGSAAELSVGFSQWVEDDEDPTLFTSTKLHETAQVTARFAAQPGAGLTAVRQTMASRATGDVGRLVEEVLSRLAAARTDVSTPERVAVDLGLRQRAAIAALRLRAASLRA